MADDLEKRLAEGDEAVLDDLLREHVPRLRGFVRLHMGGALRQREESIDLVQSVCREILEHRERFRYPGENGFRRWLYTTALRKIHTRIEHWGAQRRDPGREVPAPLLDELLDGYGSVCTPSREVAAREQVERIEAAFDALPGHYREVIALSRIAGLPHAEIAERMGKNEGAVRMLLSRALARLAELLEEPEA
jgi:RNA polymerase sigma-70 factor (ECF subfamily)